MEVCNRACFLYIRIPPSSPLTSATVEKKKASITKSRNTATDHRKNVARPRRPFSAHHQPLHAPEHGPSKAFLFRVFLSKVAARERERKKRRIKDGRAKYSMPSPLFSAATQFHSVFILVTVARASSKRARVQWRARAPQRAGTTLVGTEEHLARSSL